MSIDYRGERFRDFNVPKRTPSHPTKSHAVLAKVGDVVKLIRFGQQGVKGSPKRAGESERERKRRAAFKARHAQSIAKGKLGAAWWADRVKWGTNPTERTMRHRRSNPGDIHIDIESHNRSPGYRENTPINVGDVVQHKTSGERYTVLGIDTSGRRGVGRTLYIIGRKKILGRMVDEVVDDRYVTPVRPVSLVSPGTEYRENAGAKMRVTIDSWIKALSFFERYRRGSEAKLGHNTIVRTRSTGVPGSDDVEIVLHSTPIVTYHADGTVTLNSGGWQTATTKARMNELLPAHLGIVQEKGKWFVREGGDGGRVGQRLAFFDGMRVGVK